MKKVNKYEIFLKKLDVVLKYGVATALLAVPLYAKFPFITVPGTFVSIRLEDFIIAFLGLLLAVYIVPKLNLFFDNSLNRSILLYIAIGLISVLSAMFITKTVPIHIGLLHWARRIEYFIPFFVGVIAIERNRKNFEFYFKIILLVLFLTFLYGFGQKYFGWPIIITQNMEYSKGVALTWIPGSHINSTFAGHYDLATFLVLLLPIIIPAIFMLKKSREKVVLTIVSLGGLWLMANAVSRISIFSYFISVTMALLLLKKIKAIPIVIIVSLIFFGMTSNVITRYSRIFDVVQDKLIFNIDQNLAVFAEETTPPPDPRVEDQKSSPLPEDRSSSIRFNVEWPRAIRAMSKNPILGTGFSSITLATDNDYLRFLGETGVVGFLAFMLVLFRLILAYISNFPFKIDNILERVFVIGVFSSIPGLLINAVFIDIFEASKFAILFWFIVGFSIPLMKTKLSE